MRPLEYLKELSFPRMGGSDSETKASRMITEWLTEFGYSPQIEKFDIYTYIPGRGSLKPLDTSLSEIPINPVGLSADCDMAKEIILLNIPEPEWAEKDELKNKIVLMPHPPRRKWVSLLVESNASAGIIVVDDIRIRAYRTLGQEVARDFGEKIPLATIGYKYAIGLINENVRRVHIKTEHKRFDGNSQNVIAELAGESERTIIITAHYDSTPSSPGAQDNAAGTVELLQLAKKLAGNKFYRNIRFLFCGAEEMGLLGSKAFVRNHIHELRNVDFLINLDVGGNPIAPVMLRTLGTDNLEHFIGGILKSKNCPAQVESDIYSSDGMPFARFGVPSVSIARAGINSRGHSPYDDYWQVSNRALMEIVDCAEIVLSAIADAKVLPFQRTIADEMMKKVDEYFKERE